MEQWQLDIIDDKLEAVNKQLFSLEIDMRVAVRLNQDEVQKRVVELTRLAEGQKAILEEIRNGSS